MRQLYIIGGSTCCGKSSMAALLAKKHGLRLYKLDDHLDRYMERLAGSGNELCRKTRAMSMEQMWMRSPEELCEEELDIYRAMYPLVRKAIDNLKGKEPILAEGAGFLPELVHGGKVDSRHYVCCVPTRTFQFQHYSQRGWIKTYLKGCTDPDAAFRNWMDRDALFARQVLTDARQLGYETLEVDGKESIEENALWVARQFGLVKPAAPSPEEPEQSKHQEEADR